MHRGSGHSSPAETKARGPLFSTSICVPFTNLLVSHHRKEKISFFMLKVGGWPKNCYILGIAAPKSLNPHFQDGFRRGEKNTPTNKGTRVSREGEPLLPSPIYGLAACKSQLHPTGDDSKGTKRGLWEEVRAGLRRLTANGSWDFKLLKPSHSLHPQRRTVPCHVETEAYRVWEVRVLGRSWLTGWWLSQCWETLH